MSVGPSGSVSVHSRVADSVSSNAAEAAEAVRLARAYLGRVAEPADLALYLLVEAVGPVEAAERIRARDLTGLPDRVARSVLSATEARHAQRHAEDDLAAAGQLGIDFVTPEDERWPHFAFGCFQGPVRRRTAQFLADGSSGAAPRSGELVPPLGLWVRGAADLAGLGTRSVAVVGSRASTAYGERIASELASGCARREIVVVSGGAYGIDAAAHRGALALGGTTVLVSAGGLDRPYPPGNSRLFDAVAPTGLLVSESPPGSAPQRHRFLTRNRLIAALAGATIVVEAARRSGAINTAAHARGLGRQLFAVPGPITSALSVGCHDLLAHESQPAQLVTSLEDVLTVVSGLDGPMNVPGVGPAPIAPPVSAEPSRAGTRESARLTLRRALDRLDPTARRVYEGLPARGWAGPDSLAARSGVPVIGVLQAVPVLELAGLAERGPAGVRRRRPS